MAKAELGKRLGKANDRIMEVHTFAVYPHGNGQRYEVLLRLYVNGFLDPVSAARFVGFVLNRGGRAHFHVQPLPSSYTSDKTPKTFVKSKPLRAKAEFSKVERGQA
jgi:hypothetical protein